MDHDVVRDLEPQPWPCPLAGCPFEVTARTPPVRRALIGQHIADEVARGRGSELEALGVVVLEQAG